MQSLSSLVTEVPDKKLNGSELVSELQLNLPVQSPIFAIDGGAFRLSQPLAFSPEQEKALYRRLDKRLMPILALIFFFNFLDRSSIGGARIHGMAAQLDLGGDRYNLALTAYFIPFCLLEFPSNLVLKKFRPSVWLPLLVVIWGMVVTMTGFVRSYYQLIGARACLGIAEAGLAPGVLYYLTFWYPRTMLQFRTAIFLGSSPLASACAGLFAFGVSSMDGIAGLEGWSWIFIIEGCLTVLVGFLAMFAMVDFPETAKFLTPDERAYLTWKRRCSGSRAGEEEHFELRHLWEAFCDWQVYLHTLIYISIVGPVYVACLFLSSIIGSFGYSANICNLLVIPPFAVATVLLYVSAIWSDAIGLRSPFIAAGQIFLLVGFAINIADISPGVKYFGLFLCVAGAYMSFPGAVAWLSNNVAGQYKRGIAIALQVGIGNAAGAITSNVYRDQDAPRYITGHGTMLLLVGVGLVAVSVTACLYAHINRGRDTRCRALKIDSVDGELRKRGDRAPTFRYVL